MAPKQALAAHWESTRFNADGRVADADYSILVRIWGMKLPSASPAGCEAQN